MRILIRLIAVQLFLVTSLVGQDLEQPKAGPWPAATKPAETDGTSQQIIDLHLRARGGKESLHKVTTLQQEGELIEGQLDYSITATHLAPKSARIENVRFFRGDYYPALNVTDGTNSWRQTTTMKRAQLKTGSPRTVSGLDERQLKLDAMLPFMFLGENATDNVFVYRGQENFAGREAYVLHGWLYSGMEIDILFDPKSFHIVNYRQIFKIGPKEVIVDRLPVGLFRIGSTWWEKGYSFRYKGKIFRRVTFESMQTNVRFDPDSLKAPPTRERWLRSTPE